MGRLLRVYAVLMCCLIRLRACIARARGDPWGRIRVCRPWRGLMHRQGGGLELLQVWLQPPGAAPCRAPRPPSMVGCCQCAACARPPVLVICMRAWRHEPPEPHHKVPLGAKLLPVRCLSKIASIYLGA